MFRRRAIQVSYVKTPKIDTTATPEEAAQIGATTAELVTETAKDVLRKAAIAVGAVIIAYKVADTLSQIAVKKTKSADQE